MKKKIKLIELLVSILLFYSHTVFAQDAALRIQWDSLTQLPPAAGKNNQPGVAGAFAGMHNGRMIIAGGANFPTAMPWEGGEKVYWNDIFVFNVKTKKWEKPGLKLSYPIAYGAAVNSRKGVLCIGGRNKDSVTSATFFIRHYKKNKLGIIPFVSLPEPLFNIAAVQLNGKVYVAGGEDDTSTKLVFLSIDLSSDQPQWQRLSVWEGPSVSLSVLVPLIEEGSEFIYLIGGKHIVSTDSSYFVSSLFKYDVLNNSWIGRNAVTDNHFTEVKISGGTGFSIGKHSILLAGGNTSDLYDTIIRQSYNYIHASDPADRQLKKAFLDATFRSHPGFHKKMYLYNSKTGKWSGVDNFPFHLPVTLGAFKYKNQIYLPSGEIRPGVRTPLIIRGTIINE